MAKILIAVQPLFRTAALQLLYIRNLIPMSVEWRLKYTNEKKNSQSWESNPNHLKLLDLPSLNGWLVSLHSRGSKIPVNSNLEHQKNLTKQNWHREKVSGPAHPYRKENAVVPGDRFRSIFPKTISRTNNN